MVSKKKAQNGRFSLCFKKVPAREGGTFQQQELLGWDLQLLLAFCFRNHFLKSATKLFIVL